MHVGSRRPGSAARLVTRGLLAAAVAITGLSGATGTAGATAAATASPQGMWPAYSKRCRGAAATTPGRRCARTRAVSPTPSEALLTPNVVCQSSAAGDDQFGQCTYGVPAAGALATVGVIGDSHASHWRGAIDAVAKARGWHVIEFARPHCPFTLTPTTQSFAAFCVPYNRQLIEFLGRHPEITILFASVNHFVNMELAPGQTKGQAKLEGHLAAFRALPASVQRVIVIRDNPQQPLETAACVETAMAARAFAGERCKVPRGRAIRADYQVEAARTLGAPRFTVANLTRRFCDRRYCFPVIGGVLVNKDQDHLGQRYVLSLAPFLLDAANAAVPPAAGTPVPVIGG